MFKESPKLFKEVSNKILFDIHNFSPEENAAGYYIPENDTIKILPLAFTVPHFEPTNLNFTLYHEMSHALDHKRAKNIEGYGLSIEDTKYKKFTEEDDKHQEENYGHITHVSKQAKENGIYEYFADSMAMTALIDDGKFESAILVLTNGKKCREKLWEERFPNRYEYCKNILENNTLKNIIKYYICLGLYNAIC